MAAETPQFATMKDWMALTGMSQRRTYDELGRGNLKAVKAGRRTLIEVQTGLAWLRSCPPAKIKPPAQDNRGGFAADAAH